MVAKYNSSSHLSPRKLENEKGFRDGPTTLAVPLAQRSPFLFSQLAHLPSLIINDHRRIHRSSPRSDSFHHCLVFFTRPPPCMLFIATLYIFLRDKRSEPFRKELTKDLSLGRVGTTSWMPVAPARANHFKASQLQAIRLPSLVPALPMRPYGCQIQ